MYIYIYMHTIYIYTIYLIYTIYVYTVYTRYTRYTRYTTCTVCVCIYIHTIYIYIYIYTHICIHIIFFSMVWANFGGPQPHVLCEVSARLRVDFFQSNPPVKSQSDPPDHCKKVINPAFFGVPTWTKPAFLQEFKQSSGGHKSSCLLVH